MFIESNLLLSAAVFLLIVGNNITRGAIIGFGVAFYLLTNGLIK
ncbi:hypothetical protein AsFcp4_233 [Aeromonas phage AsFcp_4]|uniref:Uncharacterized protein n=1 Tax=Aeromonas phage PX29 TaxID=926067 RepID=E5DQ10_9CAUD|nr:hypothetical protein CL89_gp077 [Aeromonas phage PX29]ADQ52796.1 conserved hypothetical protein [Aeromonas phage PX29]QAX99685.1 hypothetical protein AsFcp4_233 [Aeromonas phage AsFcp_4]